MEETLSDWGRALREYGLAKEAERFDENNTGIAVYLEKLGLPHQRELIVDGNDFYKRTEDVDKFIKEEGLTIVRLLPKNPDMKRKYRLRIESLEECLKYLSSEKLSDYKISISRMDDTGKGGVYVSNDKGTFIDMVDEIPERLTHGELIPTTSAEILSNKEILYSSESTYEDKEIIERAVEYLYRDGKFLPGMFSFIVREPEIVFVSYHRV